MNTVTGNSRIKDINNLTTEDARVIVNHYMGYIATINANDAHLRTLARNILRSRKLSVLDALIESEKRPSATPRTRGF